ncbi:GNAT family N-acetyltransferase [Pseudonocardia nematodicida]|uniref:GNAT family N-acetyltransferase n=1 Tax=Pseudonocardia nematodicida TaxID=1206997 RepID=A0ABV1KI65_9PSEU
MRVRAARPGDHPAIVGVVDDWWGRPVHGLVPRMFLDHFHRTSLVAVEDTAHGPLAGFLIGFPSPSEPAVGYIHFVGVRPDLRGDGLARDLYDRFTVIARAHGCSELQAITSPQNEGSLRFHRSLGFDVEGPVPDHDGAGLDKYRFRRVL